MADREPQPSLRPDEIVRGERYRRDLGDIDGLAASIKRSGLLHPIVVTSDNRLVAGERRLAAVKALGWHRVPVRVIDPEDLLTAERDENEVRMDFRPSEAVAIAKAIRPIEQALAAERQRAGVRPSETVSEGSRPIDRGESRERVAAAVGMSFRTLQRAEAVVAAAEAYPELAPLVERMDETGVVAPVYREAMERTGGQGNVRVERVPTGRLPVRAPRRALPWRREFTRFCNSSLPEDREVLMQLDAQIHKAIRLIGATPVLED